MTLPEVLKAIAGLPSHCAVRPRGIMIVMNTRMRVLRIGKNGPHNWAPAFSDIVALDWQALSPEQMAQARQAAAAEAAES